MTKRSLINIKFELFINRHDSYLGHLAFVWPDELWEELKSLLDEFPDEELSFHELYGKHSRAFVTYKELLEGATVVSDEEKIKEFILVYGHDHDFSEDFDPWDCFMEDIGNNHDKLRGEFPSWWDYGPSEETLKQDQENKWSSVKENLESAQVSLSDYGISMATEVEKEFTEFLDNNELELAWHHLKDTLTGHSSFSSKMSRAAKLMNLPDPFGA